MVRIILFFVFNIIILNTLSADVPEQFVDNKLAENQGLCHLHRDGGDLR